MSQSHEKPGAAPIEAPAPRTFTVLARRVIPASASRVFEAWTEPAHLRAWWGPRSVECIDAQVDLRVGGAYRLGNRFPDGSVVWIAGEFERVSPPHELVYTWRLEPGDGGEERVTVRFVERGASTEVVVMHERVSTASSRSGHRSGWRECLQRLARYAKGLPHRRSGVTGGVI